MHIAADDLLDIVEHPNPEKYKGQRLFITLTISDELYSRLEDEARARGLTGVERLLEEWKGAKADLSRREEIVRRTDQLRERLFAKYGEMPDSAELVREDRAR